MRAWLLLSVLSVAGVALGGPTSAETLEAGGAREATDAGATSGVETSTDAGAGSGVETSADAGVATTAEPLPDADARVLVAVLPFEANDDVEEQATGVTSLVASHLAEAPSLNVISQSDISTMISMEKQRALLGLEGRCEDDCLSQVSELLGARYVVSGRLDRFGKRYVVTAGLFDSQARRNLARPQAEASRADTLPSAARKVAGGLLAPLGATLRSGAGEPLLEVETDPDAGELSVGLRVSNSFIQQLAALNPGADLDLMYRFHHGWNAFLQIGFKLRRAGSGEEESGFSVLPSVLGVRHFHRIEESFQPYWGAGFGLQLSVGQFGVFENVGPLPSVVGLVGFRYRLGESFSVSLEGSTNLAQTLLGIAGSELGTGLNVDVTGGVAYLF